MNKSSSSSTTPKLSDLCANLFGGFFGYPELQEQARSHIQQLKSSNPIGFIFDAVKDISENPQSQLITMQLVEEVEDLLSSTSSTSPPLWLSLELQSRDHFKEDLFVKFDLSTDYRACKSLSRIIAHIFKIELPLSYWPLLMTSLSNFLDSSFRYVFVLYQIVCKLSNSSLQSSLQPADLEKLYRATIRTVRDSTDENFVRAGLKTLTKGYRLFRTFLEDADEFGSMLSLVTDKLQSDYLKIKRESTFCIYLLCTEYYSMIQPHIHALVQAMGPLFVNADSIVAEHSIEMWNHIVLTESQVLNQQNGSGQQESAVLAAMPSYVVSVAQELVPFLLERLNNTPEGSLDSLEGSDHDCLMLLSNVLDMVVEMQNEHMISNFEFSQKVLDWITELRWLQESSEQAGWEQNDNGDNTEDDNDEDAGNGDDEVEDEAEDGDEDDDDDEYHDTAAAA